MLWPHRDTGSCGGQPLYRGSRCARRLPPSERLAGIRNTRNEFASANNEPGKGAFVTVQLRTVRTRCRST